MSSGSGNRQPQTSGSRERKREQFVGSGKDRRRTTVLRLVLGSVVLGFVVAAVATYSTLRPGPDAPAAGAALSTAVPVSVSAGGEIRIPLGELGDGQAKFMEHATPGGSVRFFALKGADGLHRVALDACEICFHSRLGYFQRGEEVVCRKCGNAYLPALIDERPGGCHPIRVPRQVDGEHLVVLAEDVERIHADHASRPPPPPRGMGQRRPSM